MSPFGCLNMTKFQTARDALELADPLTAYADLSTNRAGNLGWEIQPGLGGQRRAGLGRPTWSGQGLGADMHIQNLSEIVLKRYPPHVTQVRRHL